MLLRKLMLKRFRVIVTYLIVLDCLIMLRPTNYVRLSDIVESRRIRESSGKTKLNRQKQAKQKVRR